MTIRCKTAKPITEMNLKELQKETAIFDREFVIDQFQPLDAEARARWERAKQKKPGRPKIGAGAKVVSVSIDQKLLVATDRLARRRGVTRASLIARGLRAVIARETAA